MQRFNAQKVFDTMQANIQADKVSLNKVGNYMDRYAEVSITWEFAKHPQRQESFEKLFDKNAVKIFRSVAKAAPFWTDIKALRDSINVPPSKGIAFTRLLVTNAGQTKAAPTKEFAKGKADDMWKKYNAPAAAPKVSGISAATLDKWAERVEKTIKDHGAEWRGLPELLAAIKATVKLAKESQPKPELVSNDASDPVATLAQKLEIQEQRMSKMMEFIEQKMS